MSDDYLFDRSGPPDPDVVRLEQLLGPFRLRRLSPPVRGARPRAWTRRRVYLAAACLAGLVVGAWWYVRASTLPRVTVAGGSAKIDGRPMEGDHRPDIGQWIETDSTASARLLIPKVCEADVGADARVRIQARDGDQCTLELARGRLRVVVLAPAGLFFIKTPAATIVDLGCEYEVVVAPDGATRLHVISGRVELVAGSARALVFTEWRCAAHPTIGLGTPTQASAAPSLVTALERYDWGGRSREALDDVLAAVGARDGLTLWALFFNAEAAHRRAIFDRAAALIPIPAEIAPDEAVQGKAQALAGLRQALTAGW